MSAPYEPAPAPTVKVVTRPPLVSGVRFLVLAAALLFGAPAGAHWLTPEEIIAGIGNPALGAAVGITSVRSDPGLPRLLIISVDRDRWEAVPAPDRVKLAEDWYQTWRHNVSDGIVAIVDVATHQSVVHFDAFGKAAIRERRQPVHTPAPTPPGPAS